jgi:hypothetical protein
MKTERQKMLPSPSIMTCRATWPSTVPPSATATHLEADVDAGNHDGVAVNHVSGGGDQQRGGENEKRVKCPSTACRSAIRLALARLLTLLPICSCW